MQFDENSALVHHHSQVVLSERDLRCWSIKGREYMPLLILPGVIHEGMPGARHCQLETNTPTYARAKGFVLVCTLALLVLEWA